MKNPKEIKFSIEDKEQLIERINSSSLLEKDKEIVLGIIDFNSWLQQGIEEKEITIHRLRKIFGSNSEKKADNSSTDDDSSEEATPETTEAPDSETTEADDATQDHDEDSATAEPSSHGRLKADDYVGANIVNIKLDGLKVGDICPEPCCNGRLKAVQPGVIIKLTSPGLVQANKYVLERLRCNLCDKYFNASLPADVSPDKYDAKVKANIVLNKHYLEVPNHRLSVYQGYVGAPLPDSTQWDKQEEVADDVYPIYRQLEYCAANGELGHGDDTRLKIIARDTSADGRKGCFTSGFLFYYQGHKIHLFINGRQHAGENIKRLLLQRETGSRLIYMCDALSRNMPADLAALICNCLPHGRRGFVELEKFFPAKCGFVLEQFARIYRNDVKAKQLPPLQRLKYHRCHSRAVVKQLYRWLIKQQQKKLVEPNSSLGKAINYMIKHAKRLTRFLRVAGAPLDNNIVEAALKLAIRVRKNLLFYATEHGANVGGILQSVIYTSCAAGVNPLDYLVALQDNRQLVRANPANWMPWNYKSNQVAA